MRPSATALRERVAAAVDHPEGPRRAIARRFRVRLSFLVGLFPRRRAADTLEPTPAGGGPPPALGPDDQERLAELIGAPPDATWKPLKPRGGFTGRRKTRWRALRQRGRTLKKKRRHASEPDRPDVPPKRRSCRKKVRRIASERRVFGDETGVTTAMTPASAWSPRGARAVDSAPGSWASVTVIATLGRDGVCTPLAFPDATDPAAFPSDVDPGLGPAWPAGDVVVRDHLTPPLASGVAAALERAGTPGLPRPPSSPDDTPIEEMDSKVKTCLRRIAAGTKGDLDDAIGEARKQVTAQDFMGWFKEAGLGAIHG